MFFKENIKFFSFDGYEYDQNTGIVVFKYSFDDKIVFTEQLTFLGTKRVLSNEEYKALCRVFEYLHITIGISYYKAALPKQLLVRGIRLSKASKAFFEKLYTIGLQEFAYTNNVSLTDRVNFSCQTEEACTPFELSLRNASAIPMGGGKDSFVSCDILKKYHKDATLLHIGNHVALRDLSADENIIRVTRKLSGNLFSLNDQGAYNGHIPISSIYAFITLACSVIYNFDTVVMSNERSADFGSNMPSGEVVNHQYSKSSEFEKDFINLVNKEIISSFRYFSILRPFSELSIAQMFSKLKHRHAKFISCNDVSKSAGGQTWCLNCPKCHFVFLSLAPYIKKDELLSIFKENLLNSPDQLDGYKALVEYGAPKPFECVGEVEESLVAFHLLSLKPEWKDDLVVSFISENVLNGMSNVEALKQQVLMPEYEQDNMPDEFVELTREYFEIQNS